ncbi:hypothetical protein ACFU8I_11750 [Streptomyces sp. NPDC057540]|uniref:hypothetical protein n=1 Tax=Streptomyces sp. NPDC057540 TaxID=3346160 RepID=UPI0036C3AD60
MVFVARKRVLVDALVSLPDDQRRRLEASEPALIEFLDRRARREAAPRRRPGPKPG